MDIDSEEFDNAVMELAKELILAMSYDAGRLLGMVKDGNPDTMMLVLYSAMAAHMANNGTCPHCLAESVIVGLNMSPIAQNTDSEPHINGHSEEDKNKMH